MAFIPSSGSIVAFQSNPSVLQVLATVANPAALGSVSGTVGASIIGQLPAGTAVLGSVATLQGTTPWIGTNVGSIITVGHGSIAVAIISGSVAATFTPPANQSVSGTVGASIIGQLPAGVAMLGSVAAYQGAVPWAVAGSVVAFQAGTQVTSLVSTVPSSVLVGASIFGALPAGNAILGAVAASISGTVATTQTGTWISSLVSTVPSSVLVGASIFGQLPAGTAVIGSVATLQGTNPWVVNFQNSSIIAINAGSVIAIPAGSIITVFGQSPSIVGTYAEDAASATGDKGFLVMGARNDTLASVTSADGDYSSHVVGPAGELIAENAPLTKWISGTASMLGGTPVTGSLVPIIGAQGASIFTYITGLQIANASATNVWITLLGGTNSVIGFTVAPANGGSNIYYQNGIKTNANAAFSASVSAVSSVYLSAQGFISKT